jgi:hypothetical protein
MGSALGIALLVHVLISMLLAFIVIQTMNEDVPELIVGFFGSTSTASRVVFIVDVSASLSSKQFEMIKKEQTKSLMKLAASIQYQVIFFAGSAWFAPAGEGGRCAVYDRP